MKSEWDDLDQLKRNLERALEDIYRHYQRPFLHWMRRQWSGIKAEDHMDVFQDTVIQTWENVASGRLKTLTTTLWNYMRGIGHLMAQAYWRKNRQFRHFDNMAAFLAEIDPDAELQQLKEEQLALIWAHIDQMKDPNRSILTLTYKYGLSSAEIAEIMSYDTENGATSVAVQRNRAMNQLKESLNTQKITSS